MEHQFVDATEAELKQAAAVAHAQAASAERWGYIVAAIIGVGGIMAWYVSIPVAIAVYMLLTKGPNRARDAADNALSTYREAMPSASGY